MAAKLTNEKDFSGNPASTFTGIWIDQQQCRRAADTHSACLADNPSDFSRWVELGDCAKHAGQLPRAIEAFEVALKLNPGATAVREELKFLTRSIEAALGTPDDGNKVRLPEDIPDLITRLRALPRKSDPFHNYFDTFDSTMVRQ